MALVLSGERPVAAATLNPVRIVATFFARVKTGRAQRLALHNLLSMDAYRLDDLGINRGDLFDAIHSQSATRLLADRRAHRHHY